MFDLDTQKRRRLRGQSRLGTDFADFTVGIRTGYMFLIIALYIQKLANAIAAYISCFFTKLYSNFYQSSAIQLIGD